MSEGLSPEDFVDGSAWPLLVVRGPKIVDNQAARSIVSGLVAALDRGQRFCIHVDMTATTRFEWSEIKVFDAFARANGDRLDTQVAALALVIPSAMVRGAIRVLFKLKAPGHPYEVLADEYIAPFLAGLARRVAASG